MADIFGREPLDYETNRVLLDELGEDGFRARSRDAAERTGIPEHDFNALGTMYETRVRDNEAHAQALSYITNNLQAVQSMIEEILYTRFRLNDFIPVISNVPEGATTYSYRVVDHVGEGRFIETGGTDAPSATVSQRNVPYAIEYAGIVPEWDFEQLRRAMFAGVPLDTETIEAAVTGAMNHIEKVGLHGDDLYGFQGLINHSAVTSQSGSDLSGLISGTSGGQGILDYLQARTTDIITNTKEVFGQQLRGGYTIYLPIEQAALVTNTRLTEGNDMTVWRFFETNNAWFNYTGERPMLKWVQELAAANNSDLTQDRMIIGLNNPRIMEMAMPISPRVIHTITQPFKVCAPIEYKLSGLNLKRPAGLRYYNGV